MGSAPAAGQVRACRWKGHRHGAPERARHNLLKAHACLALRDAIKRSGANCTAYTDGMTVKIDSGTAREPDALVQCGKPIDLDELIADNPVIVVEIVSPSFERDDTTKKLSEYFSVGSIQHYLVVDGEKRLIIHHGRRPDGDILTRIHSDGEIGLEPPGLKIPFTDMMPALD